MDNNQLNTIVSPDSVNNTVYSNSSNVQNSTMVSPTNISTTVNNQSNITNIQQIYNQSTVEKPKLNFSDKISNFRDKLDTLGKSKAF